MIIRYKAILSTILSSLFLTSFIWTYSIYNGVYEARLFYFYFVTALTISFACITLIFRGSSKGASIDILDFSLILFLAYSLIRLILTQEVTISNDQFVSLYLLTSLYFVLKYYFFSPTLDFYNSSSLQIITTSLLLSILFQAVYGAFQLYDMNPGFPNPIHKVVGTIGDPNIYACLLCAGFIFALKIAWFLESSQGRFTLIRYIAFATAIISLLVIPVTFSRNGWICTIFGLAMLFYKRLNISKKTQKFRKTKFYVAAILIALLCSSFAVYGLYKLKPRSAEGRVFIWKTSLNMIQDNFWFGIGFDRFDIQYNNYKVNYFKSGAGTESQAMTASYVKFTQNEYLQLLVEQGFVGLLLFSSTLTIILIKRRKILEHRQTWLEGVLISFFSILIFAFSSYPFHNLSIRLVFFVQLALLSAGLNLKKHHLGYLQPTLKKILLTLLLFSMGFIFYDTVIRIETQKKWKDAIELEESGQMLNAIATLDKIYRQYNNNGEFLYLYGSFLYKAGQIERAKTILLEATIYSTSPYLYILLGNIYVDLNEWTCAEHYYVHAVYIEPFRFYPRYCLFQHYANSEQYEKAIQVSQEALNMKIKVNSSAIIEMRGKMQNFLITHSN